MKLTNKANQKDISVNTLVSHIIRRHIDWHSNAAKAGFVTVRSGLLSNLINRLPEKEISSTAEDIAKNETKDFVMLLRNEHNIESALDVIEMSRGGSTNSSPRVSGWDFLKLMAAAGIVMTFAPFVVAL